ncbi:hypothetical protein WJX72_009631 [[Myrmecia] bisecta]|uniref:Uncharacterized protein n=1 Tax=[Myrmecia] bisecta TaxID=41462 RepID=A0AAW1R940_9CHLO
MDKRESADQSLAAYISLLRHNPKFRIVWIGELVNSAGSWFNYVATLTLVERLAGGSGLLLSLIIVIRFIPMLIFFPAAGVVADRYSRVDVLMHSCLLDAVVVAGLALVRRPQDAWLLYVLAFLQYTMAAFYDPARRALTPTIVPEHQLHLATTLDSFSWSVMGAFGASLGGWAVSRLGTSACFLLDAATYLVAAYCAFRLRGQVPPPGKHLDKERSGIDANALESPKAPSPPAHPSTNPSYGSLSPSPKRRMSTHVDLRPSAAECKPHIGPDAAHVDESSTLQGHPDEVADSVKGARGCCGAILHAFRDEINALHEGWAYICSHHNRDVAVLVFIKACGSLTWGAADVLNVRFSEMPRMQTLGDASTTLGFLFSSVGVGCFFGPIFFNKITPPRLLYLLRSIAATFACFMLGYLLMMTAPSIAYVMLSTVLRSAGSSTIWVYSTLLLQLRVPNELQGRIMALEMALFTVTDCVSSFFGGFAFDVLRMDVRRLSGVMAGVAAFFLVAWSIYAWQKWREAGGPGEGAYQRVSQTELTETGKEAV